MTPLVWLVLELVADVVLAEDAYEYDTSAIASPPKGGHSGGQRLVGAAMTSHTQLPFLVAWTNRAQEGRDESMCTGSLITTRWVVTAAHCDDYLFSDKIAEKKCVALTARGKTYSVAGNSSLLGSEYKCRILRPLGNLEIIPVRPPAKAWIGAANLNQDGANKEHYFTAVIGRVIRHPRSYRGGGTYGTYGGYDITLLELSTPVPPEYGTPACLPTPSFKDTSIKASLAGYGQYYRRDMYSPEMGQRCQTDEYGRNKFHMCRDPGRGDAVCHMDRAPPRSRACAAFFAATGLKYPEEYEEIQLVDEASNSSSFCFATASPQPRSRGWCEVAENYYGYQEKEEAGWGFCGSDCFLGEVDTAQAQSVLRRLDGIQVLPDPVCQEFLKEAVGPEGVEVMPKIICLGSYRPWRTQVWKRTQGGSYVKLDDNSEERRRYHHFGDVLGIPAIQGYVTAVGSCRGDSGGPAFVQEGKKFIIIGAVSGGRGRIGMCGGINNPVHYTRLSRFALWIVKTIGTKEAKSICWHNKLKKKKKRRHRRQRRQ